MRTKVLIAAALLAASLASSMAQNVYSLNVVGYVNVTLPPSQFTAIANPLDASMGGTVPNGNDMATLFGSTNGNIANGSKIQQFVSALNDYSAAINYSGITKKWASTFSMAPGVGALYYNNGATPTVVTFTGQVPQGSYNVANLGKSQFTMVGSPVPIGGDVTNSTTVVGLVPNNGDTISTFNSGINDYNAVTKWSAITKKWSVSATSTLGIAPGQAFLYYNNGAANNAWVSNFTVQ
jgi:hypothetical protein